MLDVAGNVIPFVAGGDDDIPDVHLQRRRQRFFDGVRKRIDGIRPDETVAVVDLCGEICMMRLEKQRRLCNAAFVDGGTRPVEIQVQPAQFFNGLEPALGGFKIALIGVAFKPACICGKRKHRHRFLSKTGGQAGRG